ncbi:MAG: glycosyltransferase family 4 protein [Bacteroidetes bacterium]|nr:glycosyltransferase family 4 protein [Bacteroidota bacterium]
MAEKRKIVIIGTAYPFRGGGLSTYNERLARAFMQKGDDVVIHTFSLQYPNFLFPGKTQYSDGPAPKDLNIKISVNSINPFNWLKIGRKLRKYNADIVIMKFWIPFMGPCLGTIARLIKKNKHSKIISIIDNIIPHEKRVGDWALAKYFVKSVDGFVAMSESVLDDLGKFDSAKPKLFCAHPLYDNYGEIMPKEVAKLKLALYPSLNYLLFFGFIRDYKGLDLLLEAFSICVKKNKSLRLIVAGEFYTDPIPYFNIIKKYNLDDFVLMYNDFIPDEKVAEYFCASDVVVQPYKNATQSGVTQIAYHFNKPMIVTNVGGLAEIVPDNKVGYVVTPDINEIAAAILKFYEERKEEEFSKNAEIEKVKYSWDNMVDAVEKLTS